MRLCGEVSDAVTRAAHGLGIVASRELLKGYHFITCFAPLDQMPTEEDLVLCRTWGQFDPALYNGSHSRSGKPFFGERGELAELLADAEDVSFAPEAVIFRQITHAPGQTPRMPHDWLCTTPEELISGGFEMGETARGAYRGQWDNGDLVLAA